MKHQLLCVATVLILAGCSEQQQGQSSESSLTFAKPEEAVDALAAAAEKHDVAELGKLFGPGTADLLSSGDEVEDRAAREGFLKRFKEKHDLVSGGPNDLMLQVGADDWPLPIPLVKENGRWHFDGAAGAEKIIRQRHLTDGIRDVLSGKRVMRLSPSCTKLGSALLFWASSHSASFGSLSVRAHS